MSYIEPESFSKLKKVFRLLPGVGEKTAERYAFSILNLPVEKVEEFSTVLNNFKCNLTICENCGCLCEKNKCSLCDDELRESEKICVVESPRNALLFEKSGIYTGKYHVLGGLISPMEGINPENLTIGKLLQRVEQEKIKEVILALKPGIEGETTSLYLKRLLEDKSVKVSQIAQGIPVGADLEYLDALTLELALSNRKELS